MKTFRTARRLGAATVIATSALLAATATGGLAVANAEWDIGAYDACVARETERYMAGDVTTESMQYGLQYCCTNTAVC